MSASKKKLYVETRRCDDGFSYEIWTRSNIHGESVYYPVTPNTEGKLSLLGGCLLPSPDEVHKVMKLPR